MATEVSELLVKMTPQGMEETANKLEDQREAFEQTADTAEEQTGKLENFSERWQGAMSVVVAGLAVATAGLASKIPLLGELFAGLNAILTAIGFQIDRQLRPAFGGLTKQLFEFANMIFKAKGAAADFWAALGATTIIATVVGAIATLLSELGLLGSVLSGLSSIAGTVASAITGIVAILGGPLTVAIVAIVAAITGLALAWQNNWFNIRGITSNVVSTIVAFFKKLWRWLTQTLPQAVATFASTLVKGFRQAINSTIAALGKFIVAVARVLNEVERRIDVFAAAVRTGFETLWDLVVAVTKQAANALLSTITNITNEIIGLLNAGLAKLEAFIDEAAAAAASIPGVNVSGVDLGRIETVTAPTIQARSAQDIVAAGRRRLARRRRRINEAAAADEQAIIRKVDQLVTALQLSRQEFKLNLDAQTVASETQPFFGEDVGSRGR